MKTLVLTISIILSIPFSSFSQPLKPGFDYEEYITMLQILAYQVDTPWTDMNIEYPEGYMFDYRSHEVGLMNKWDLWISDDSIVIVSIRGTVGDFTSWLENFYAAMIPASGKLQLGETEFFEYKFSTDPKSAVHVGWTIALAYMQTDIEHKIDSCLNLGYSNFIVTGHSQGGAIAYLLTANLWIKKNMGRFGNNFTLKTYCSAAPKPGNINFAREYEYLTQDGWAYNVVNAADWVPELPFSVQTLNDINETNPISDKKQALKNQGLFARMFMGSAYNKVTRPLNKSVKRLQKYLGKKAYKFVIKSLPDFENPKYAKTNYYVRTGNTITLYPDSAYNEIFAKNPKHKFVHHMLKPYLYLAKKQKKELLENMESN